MKALTQSDWRLWQRINWRSPFTVMVVILLMYVVKTAGKLLIGRFANSPMIYGDGLHNVADIGEAVLVILAIAVSQLTPENLKQLGVNTHYPFGLKAVQYVGQVVIGISLTVMAFGIMGKGLAGILAQFPAADTAVRGRVGFLPAHQPLHFGLGYLPWVLGVTGTSAILSLFAGIYQKRIGRATGQNMLVADGQETHSDGKVELATLAGIVGEYAFGLPWLEYPFTVLVSLLMFKTALEIIKEGLQNLMRKSLGPDLEKACVASARAIPGICDVEEITTFGNGDQAVCIIKCLSRRLSAGDDLRHAIKARLTPVFAAADHNDVRFYVRFHAPLADEHRWAVAVAKPSDLAAVAKLSQASHLRVADVTDGDPIRVHDVPIGGHDLTVLVDLLRQKRVRLVWSWDRELPPETAKALADAGIAWRPAPTNAPEALGV